MKITIHCVDDETTLEWQSNEPGAILDYLKKHDHEGSSVILELRDEDVYEVLLGMLQRRAARQTDTGGS